MSKACNQCGTQLQEDATFCSSCGAPQNQQQTYENQPVQYQQQAQSTSGKATASLVLGIISLVAWLLPLIGWPISIVGTVLGSLAKKETPYGNAKTGFILSIAGLALTAINSISGAILGFLNAM